MSKKIENILRFGMKMEKNAQDFYSFYANNLQDEGLKKLFEEFVKIEQEHYKYLENILKSLDSQEPPISISWVVDDQNKMVDPHILVDNSVILETDFSDLTILRLAYLIEGDFAAFYKHAAEKVEDSNVKGLLLHLAKWEEEHEKYFKERYHSLMKKEWKEIDLF
ncbi:Rubrerythrin [Caldicellulosiruptor obsidiansis OB47]|jgi:rubrerythrin|uniref:Rubrerythrin n=1 Tax=Caldicellulosiruptor obsidiansis (strain ATCC BAA-2073 / JCM 16842 / OB47) TaxID=608506 RepID=D9TID5_CALOO|nr:ferritin family protein [Caldicellulosiruptor obsidiansis]ADL41767.1 Rubrerythrin [Caldicellulosiruptor obsidiansis OB47]